MRRSQAVMIKALQAATTALLIACLSLTLELLSDLRLRLDLSQDQSGTPDPQLTALLMGLEEPVTLEAVLPLSAPAPYGPQARALATLLKALEAQVSSRRLQVQVTDSEALSEREASELRGYAERVGIPVQRMQGREGGRLISLEVPVGVRLTWLNEARVLKLPERAERAEGALLQSLSLLVSKRAPLRVGASTGHGEPSLVGSPLALELAEPGMLKEVRLDDPSLSEQLDVLLILGASRPLGERARYLVDQLLCAGGSVVIGYDLETREGMRPSPSGLEPLLRAHGVELSWAEVLSDPKHPGAALVSSPSLGAEVRAHDPHSPWVQSSTHPISAPLRRLISPQSSPLRLSGKAEPLLITYKSATRQPRGGLGRPQRAGELPLAAAVKGRFKSLYGQASWAPPQGVGAQPCAEPRGEARLVLLPSGRRLLSAHERGPELLRRASLWARRRPLLTRAPRALGVSSPVLREPATSLRWWGTLAPLSVLILAGLARLSLYRRQRAAGPPRQEPT